MNTINFDEKAALAEAAYADFGSLEGDYSDAEVLDLLISGDFAKSQAEEFVRGWKVVSHTPNTKSGYSATLFKSKKEGGSFFYAVRGTEERLNDLVKADLGDIVGNGLAIDQIVDMYNDWKRLVTDEGKSFQAVRLTELAEETAALRLMSVGPVSLFYDYQQKLLARGDIVIQGVGALASVRRIEFGSSENILLAGQSKGLGKLAANQQVSAIGHSLGGHLAFAFSRLFGVSNQVEVTALNGAGFANGLKKGLGGNAAGNIENIFSTLGGAAGFNVNAIQNFYGSAGPNIITMDSEFGLQQPGRHTEIFIESAGPGTTFGHGSAQMVDSLSVMQIFLTLDETLANTSVKAWTAKLNAIFEAASVKDDAAFEAVLDAWGDLLIPGYKRLDGPTEGREDLYSRIKSIRSVIDSKKANVVSLVGMAPGEIASLANSSEGEAYRLALLKLSPFAITGLDYSSQSNLVSLYDSQTGQGVLTSEWLLARAELLSERLTASTMDVDAIERARALSLYLRGALVSENSSIDPLNLFGSNANELLSVGATLERGSHLFGESGNDTLAGQALDDYLEGGSGNDELKGNAGDDWLRGMQDNDTLIGGSGNDLLEGGQGSDVYKFSSGDGFDRIRDNDGQIYINGEPVPVLKKVASGVQVWSDKEKVFFAVLGAGDQGKSQLLITYGKGDRIVIEDFRLGSFGLKFEEVDIPVVKSDQVKGFVIEGDFKPVDQDPDEEGVQLGYDELGNVYVDLLMGVVVDKIIDSDRKDQLYGSVGNNEIYGYGGDDALYDGRGGHDLLDGGPGDDVLYSGKGNDSLVGGIGDDLLFSEQDNDLLDGGVGDDLLSGEEGDDSLIGGLDSDRLQGGDGDDLLIADELSSLEGINRNSSISKAGGRGDWLDGGADDDTVVGSVNQDALLGGSGDDRLYGGDGNDNLYGDYSSLSAAKDWSIIRSVTHEEKYFSYRFSVDGIEMSAGNDVLMGGGGDDWMDGGGGNDVLDGGEGQDVIFGQEGNDTLLGGAGNDVLVGDNSKRSLAGTFHGNDFVDGGDGNDDVDGNGGSDILLGGAGDDSLTGDGDDLGAFSGDDFLDGGSGKDFLEGNGGNDTLLGGDESDYLVGDAVIDVAYSGNDYLDGGAGNDTLIGGARNDSLFGGVDNDVIYGDDDGLIGDDYIDGGAGDDKVVGGFGSDTILGGEGNDSIWGDENVSSESIQALGDYLDGGLGNDAISGGGGDDTVIGGAGDDSIQGDAGSNILDGGTGNDALWGEGDNDTYIFGLGYGVDQVKDKGGANVIRFGPGITFENLSLGFKVSSQGDVLVVGIGSDALFLHHVSTWASSRFIFSSGDSYSYEKMLLKLPQAISQKVSFSTASSVMFGSLYNDSLAGGEGNDSLKGQAGNDTLVGGKGDDTYLFNVGDGQDLITDAEGSNVINFGADITSSSLTFSTGFSAEGESYLKVGYGDDFVMIERGLWGAIKAFEFADGTFLSFADAMRRADNLVLVLPDEASRVYGSDQADRIYGGLGGDAIDAQGGDDQVSGGAGSDTLVGGEGNDGLAGDQGDDQLFGGSGNDQLLSGEGNDLLNGGEGNDWLSGGAGQDTLNGGTGTNTYVFERGVGFDLIELTEGESAILKIGSDIFRQDLISRQDGKDLLLEVKGSQDGARLKDYFSASRDWKVDAGSGSLVELTTFLTTTSSGYSMTADEAERVFRQQVLTVFKERMDTINAQALADGTYRTHSVSESVSSRVDSYSNYSLVFSEEAVSSVVRSENRYAYRSTSEAKDSRSIRLSGGSDTVYGSGDFVSFAQFNKMLNGRAGGLQTDGWVPVFKYNNNTRDQELIGWQVTSWDDTALSAKKTFTTTNVDNLYVNKIVQGDAYDRNVVVGLGNIYRGGEGSEQLYGEDLNYANSSVGVFLDGGAGNDYLAGSRENDFLVGGLGNDTLEGDAGSDTYIISRGEGVSVISDSFRSINYVGYDPDRLLDGYHRGYSELTPDESEKNDIIILPEGVALADLKLAWGRIQHEVYVKDAVLYDPTRRYGATKGIAGSAKGIMAVTTLDLSWSDNQKIRIVMPFQHDPIGSGIDKIQFADGTVLTLEQLRSKLGLEAMPDSYAMDQRLSRSDMDGLHLQRADGPDSVLGAAGGYLSPYAKIAMPLVGGSGSDTLSGGGVLWGGDGNDSLLGDTGADDLIGGFGADTLLGGEGDDRLGASLDDFYGEGNLYQGGLGQDYIFGTLASDTYIYDRGDGADRIIDLYAPGYFNAQLYYNGSAQAVLDDGITSPFSPLLLSRQTMSWRNQYDSDGLYYKELDTVRFGKDIGQGDLRFELEGSDLVIGISGSEGDSLRFVNWSLFASKPLGRIAFADGTVLEGAALSERLPKVLVLSGTDGSDYFGDYPSLWVDYVVHGQGGNDTLQGTFGNNTFYGDQGNDWLESGRGNDYLNGGEGDDTLWGSSGNDTLEGGAGNDVYAFSRYSMEQGVTRILDTDKVGFIQFDWKAIDAAKVETVARNQWRALDGSYLLTFDDVNAQLLLQAIDDNGSLLAGKVVVSSFGNGDLGLLLPGLEVAAQVPAALKALPEQRLSSGHEWSYALSADSFFPQGSQALVYSAMLKDGSALPSWLEIDAATGTLHGNAPGVGSLSLIVQAVDTQGKSVRQSLDVKIEFNRIEAVEGMQSFGGNGDDYIIGTAGDNQVSGGSGNDVVEGGEGTDHIWGGDGNDQLLGGGGNDFIQGSSGEDYVSGGVGEDQLWGGEGDDILDGGIGQDFLWGEGGDDLLLSGVGDDSLQGGNGNDTLDGGEGIDWLWGEAGDDKLSGGAGNDSLQGGEGNDVLDGGEGMDWLWGEAGADELSGGAGNDSLQGGNGNDVLDGGIGEDYLWGEEGDDRVLGASGDDSLQGGNGNDTLEGGEGADWLWAEDGNDRLLGSAGDDSLQGGLGDDSLDGGTGADQLWGGEGNDLLSGGAGNDYLNGGGGADTYLFGIGSGQDTVSTYESWTSSQDALLFKQGISIEQIWFTRSDNDLQVSLIGRDDRVTLSYWYADESSRLGQLKVGDGKVLLDSQVQNLVDAMAGFAPPEAGQFTLPDNYEKQLSSVIAANWQ